jgi:hypothetical protein
MKRTDKRSRIVFLSALLLVINASAAFSQSSGGNFTITSQVVAGGGCGPDGSGGCTQSIGGNFAANGTTAEPGAADLSRQSPYSLRSGFWYADPGNTPTAAPASISGQVTGANGAPLGGVVISLNGQFTAIAITDANGNYHFDNMGTGGFYTVTPSLVNYHFAPASRSFSLVADRTDAIFTANADASPSANAIDTPEYFVRQQYLDFLGREPDQGGFAYWSAQINGCNGNAACIQTQRINVSAAFFIAQEFQQTGSFIYCVYQGALGRRPLFAEYSSDRQAVVGGGDLESEKQAFAAQFVERGEFAQKYQSQIAADSFVDALLENISQSAGVDLSAQRDALVSAYSGGTTLIQSRAAVVRAIGDNAEFRQSQYNSAFVLMEYFGYLRRDMDASGYQFWLNALNNVPGNYRGMVCSFVTSAEYQRRFGSVVTHGNGDCGP